MKKKYNSFLLANKFYFPHFGGVETTVKKHAEFLSKSLFKKVKVLVSNEKFNFKSFFYSENSKLSVIKAQQLGIFFSMPISLSYLIYFIKYAKRSDVIILHEPWPLGTVSLFIFNLIFKSSKKKIFIFWHSDTKKVFIIDQILFLLQKYNLKNSNYILVNMKQVLSKSKIFNLGHLKNKIYELPTPIEFINDDNNITTDIQNIIYLANKNNQKLFLFYGRLAKYKGIETLIKSLPYLSKKNIIIVFGKGSLEKALLKERNKKENFIFINRFITDSEKKFILKNATAFLLPSISNSETLGLTQIEALSQGCPVINTNLETAVPFVSIDGQTGRTFSSGNFLELSKKINEFPSRENKEWKKFSINAKKRYNNNFSVKVFEKKLSNLINNVIHSE